MTIRLRSDDVPPAARQDYWQQAISDSVVPMDVRFECGREFSSTLVAGTLGVVGITEVSDGPGHAVRARRHIRRSTTDLQHVFIQGHGRVVAEQGDRTTQLGPGDFAVSDLTRPYRCVHPARRAVCLTFPRGLLPMKPNDIDGLAGMRISGDRGPAALFSSFVRKLPRHLDDTDDGTRAQLGSTVLDLLAVALAGALDQRAPSGTKQRVLVQQTLAFIESRLADPALSPRTIADAHHISVRYLHKLFEMQGMTVAGRIRDRRLDRSRRDLLDPAFYDVPVSAIGARWGYPDPAAFSRAFRAAYGLPPGEYRRSFGTAPRG